MTDNRPLAELMRPQKIDDIIGQKHLVNKDSMLRKMIESDDLKSMILWEPPGLGNTTNAKTI